MDAAAIRFEESDGGQLTLRFSGGPVAATDPIDAETLRSKAIEQGYEALLFDRDALETAARSIREATPVNLAIAVRTDTTYEVGIDADRMSAWMVVHAGHGGAPPCANDAMAALRGAGVRAGVDIGAIENAVLASGQSITVARGTPPLPGRDARLEPLVEVNRKRHPQIDAKGHVDFHDLGDIPSVQAGQAVMRRHPPQGGNPGTNVLGNAIPAADPQDIQFGVRLEGVAVSPEDADVLIAEITGQPVLQRDGISVEPVLSFDVIDISAGNVDFPGSLIVRGDILSGMKVRAEGDITVHGTVESAELSAGGDITVRGGIVGRNGAQHSMRRPGSDVPTARISARGSLTARYIENAVVEARQSVRVAESVMLSDIMAVDQVIVGGKGNKGRILGGVVQATTLVAVGCLGGDGAGPTRVMAGANPLLQRALDAHRKRRDSLLKQREDLVKVVKLLASHPEKRAIYEKALLTLRKLSEDIAESQEEERVLAAESKQAEHAKIVVGEAVSAGVTVALGRRAVFVNEDRGRGVFHLDAKGMIAFGPLERAARRP